MSRLAIIYARFSSSEQSKGFSLERQHSLGLRFATEQGWTVEKTIKDEGRSAFHGANRLEGAALHQFELEAKNGLHRGKVLVVENIDRLSRQGAKAAARLIWGLNEQGVDVATYHDKHVYRPSANSEMMDLFKLIVLAQQSHEESVTKSNRTSDTWKARFKKISEGHRDVPVPHVPHWIDRETGSLIEHRVKVLNEIYDRYIDGSGIHRIATILNGRGEPTWTPADHARTQNGWFYSNIYRLLNKRAVLGEYVASDGTTLATEFYPQAITAEKWNRAQAALAMRKSNQKRSKNQNRNLLLQLVFCGECGGGAHFRHQIDKGQTYRKKNGEVVTYKRNDHRRLRCDRARRKHDCDNNTILSYDVVEKVVLDQLLPKLVDKPTESAAATELRQRIAELARLRDADQRRLNNLIDALAEGDSKAIVRRIAALENDVEQRTDEILTAKKSLAIETAKPSSDDDLSLIEGLREELISADDDVRIYARGRVNMTLRRLLKRIVINGHGTFTIEPDDYSWFEFNEEGTLLEGEQVTYWDAE